MTWERWHDVGTGAMIATTLLFNFVVDERRWLAACLILLIVLFQLLAFSVGMKKQMKKSEENFKRNIGKDDYPNI
jgi:uncharacterized membrane protein YhaH (DUF805 family)